MIKPDVIQENNKSGECSCRTYSIQESHKPLSQTVKSINSSDQIDLK